MFERLLTHRSRSRNRSELSASRRVRLTGRQEDAGEKAKDHSLVGHSQFICIVHALYKYFKRRSTHSSRRVDEDGDLESSFAPLVRMTEILLSTVGWMVARQQRSCREKTEIFTRAERRTRARDSYRARR